VSTTSQPVAPDFRLRHLGNVAYTMSVVTGAVGQILYLGEQFGGHGWSYIAAAFLAAFAEAVMVSAGDKSLHHRAHGRSWVPMLVVAVAVAYYACGVQFLHFASDNLSLAFTFGGASVIGFAQHIIDGHIRVSAYLAEAEAFKTAQMPAAKTSRSARPPAAARETAPTAPASPAVGAPPASDPHPPTPGSDAGTPESTNVRPINSAKGISERERVWLWFKDQVDAADGNVKAVTGPDLVEQFGSEHLRKKISDLRRRYENEFGDTAVNE